MNPTSPPFLRLVGSVVVVDTRAANLAYLGTLAAVWPEEIELADADVHDMQESKTAREVYVMEARKFGVQANRKSVWIRLSEVVSLSRLEDVIVY